jgi:hypothetical protein
MDPFIGYGFGFGLAALANSMFDGNEKVLIPAVYFKKLHQQNIVECEARLIAFMTAKSQSTPGDASTPGSGNAQTLSELLHEYCKCYHSKLLCTY